MTDEPMVERLTVALRELFTDGRVSTHYDGCWKYHNGCAALLAADTIDALLSQLREQRERAERAETQAYEWQWQFDQSCKTVESQTNMRLAAEIARDTWRQRAEEAEELADAITEANVRLARELLAAERTVREQREALAAIAEHTADEDTHHMALAALAPDTEGEGEPPKGTCNRFGWDLHEGSHPYLMSCVQWRRDLPAPSDRQGNTERDSEGSEEG